MTSPSLHMRTVSFISLCARYSWSLNLHSEKLCVRRSCQEVHLLLMTFNRSIHHMWPSKVVGLIHGSNRREQDPQDVYEHRPQEQLWLTMFSSPRCCQCIYIWVVFTKFLVIRRWVLIGWDLRSRSDDKYSTSSFSSPPNGKILATQCLSVSEFFFLGEE